ncbi:MAG: hypothetical protein COA78_31330 [Blastopirellula sp.]|nr:MAG: hypothetical protein COA78_31330 [Blastopirellula sp.]
MPIQQNDKTIFNAARKIEDPDQRQKYLTTACQENPQQLKKVTALLSGFESDSQFLESPAVSQQPIDYESESPGTIIGPYTIREQLGEGGMGVVYVAEQKTPIQRKVALKIIKPGMDSKQVVSRFQQERQTLALMSHANIAKVIDGGTTASGRPYFAMELVRGIPITEYCDQKKLGLRERLELFTTVCQAVQHAHLKGIIHRDLKPSNVMIEQHDTVAVPKVIDFGVAKAVNQKLSEHTVYTSYGQMIGTPMYMSPEQAELSGLDIDTRTDVYSLGVLLYELLTGSTPFDKEELQQASFDEIRRIIREDEPPKPSARISTVQANLSETQADNRDSTTRTLTKHLHGELDWIVMRALEKDRNRRYESASSFAADIERYLKDEPVEACPPSKAYRLQKFTKRNKVFLTTAVIVLIALVSGTGIASWQAVVANEAEGQARQQTKFAEQRLVEVEEQRKQAQTNYVKAREAVNLMLTRVANEHLARIPGMKEVRIQLLEDAALFYTELLKLNPRDPLAYYERGQVYELLMQFDKSRSDYYSASNLAPNNAQMHDKLAKFLTICPVQELREFKFALLHAKWAVRLEPQSSRYHCTLARVYTGLGMLDEARVECKRASTIDPNSAEVFYNRTFISLQTGDSQSALDNMIRAVKLDPSRPEYLHKLGSIYRGRGEPELAIAKASEAIAIAQETYNETFETWYGWTFVLRAGAYTDLEMHQEALADYDQAIVLGPWRWITFRRRGELHLRLKDYQKAAADFFQVRELYPNSSSTHYQFAITTLAADDQAGYRASCQKMLITFAESDEALSTHFTAWTCALTPNALEDYAPAIQLARHTVEQEPGNKQHLNGLGAILMRAGRYDAAKVELEKALAVSESDNTSSSYIRYFLAMTEHHLDHKQTAQDHLLDANNEATKELEDVENPPAWNRKLTLELLRKEAEEMILATATPHAENRSTP